MPSPQKQAAKQPITASLFHIRNTKLPGSHLRAPYLHFFPPEHARSPPIYTRSVVLLDRVGLARRETLQMSRGRKKSSHGHYTHRMRAFRDARFVLRCAKQRFQPALTHFLRKIRHGCVIPVGFREKRRLKMFQCWDDVLQEALSLVVLMYAKQIFSGGCNM